MKPLEEIGKAFGDAMRDKALSQTAMAKDLGISQTHLSRIIRGEKPPSTRVLRKLSDHFGADYARLLRLLRVQKGLEEADAAVTGSVPLPSKNFSVNSLVQQLPENGYLPVVGRAACGPWMEATHLGNPPEGARRMEFVGKRIATKRKRSFLVEAAGESMTGSGIEPGDLLLVDPDEPPASGKPALVLYAGEVTVKLYREIAGELILSPTNDRFPVLKVSKTEFVERGGIAYRVIGVQKFTEF